MNEYLQNISDSGDGHFNEETSLFEKILIFTPDQKKAKTIQKMSELAGLLYGFHKPFVYALNETEFLAHLEPRILVVSDLDPAQKLGEQLFSKGVSYLLSWENFLQYFSNLFTLQNFSESPLVYFVFIEPTFANILQGIFLLYGFEVQIINDYATIGKVLDKNIEQKSNANYFVFNLDGMPKQKKEYDKLLKQFRHLIKVNSSVAVSLLKDFSKGSLYDEILAKIKEINSVLLTKEEYILFILRYLQEFRSYEKFAKTFHKLDSAWLAERKQKPYLDKKRFSLLLRDAKSIYHDFSNITNAERRKRLWLEHHSNMNQLLLRRHFSEWLNTYIQFTDEKRKRGSFTFVGATDPEDFAETVKKINAANREDNNELIKLSKEQKQENINFSKDGDTSKYN